MIGEIKYHALKVNSEKCFGCTHCMKVCPTEAIRINNGIAEIDDKRCVDCGSCLRVCPVDAFYVEQDDLSLIHNYKFRIALFPAVMIGQFHEKYSVSQIYSALLEIGFTHVYEVEQPIKLLIDEIGEFSNAYKGDKPVISSFCPAIVRLIQIKYPSLTSHIVLRKPPHDLAAHFAIQNLITEEGAKKSDIGTFYISPCSAKMAAVKRPLGEKESIVNGIINMRDIYNRIMSVISKGVIHETLKYRQNVSREGILWSLPRGEANNLKQRAVAVDGIHNVIRILERVENEKLPDIDFLELRSCDQGCAGGILLTGNRFLNVERLEKRAKKHPAATIPQNKNLNFKLIKENLIADSIQPGHVFRFDIDRAKALVKLRKAQKIICQLPGIDCGACGAPNCQALAEDMVLGKAKMSDCIFLHQWLQKEGKITTQKAFDNLEKKWGENRFEADCNKKGARNEGF